MADKLKITLVKSTIGAIPKIALPLRLLDSRNQQM